MTNPSSTPETGFLADLITVIDKNISNELFGVSELADEMNMSRSNLLRKVKKETNLSVSQLISQVRLKRAMELLKNTSFNVSEVSGQVGFNSTSYFIKCFREYYGYPPGEVGKGEQAVHTEPQNLPDTTQETITPVAAKRSRSRWLALAGVASLLIILAIYLLNRNSVNAGEDKSIAVLPFKNDSNDSTNLYLINGLMESTLNKLQQIENLRVVSRTSVEKYRHTSRSIPEMAKELNVKYFVEGSGQKIGDRIVLNIQLIEASTDKHVWSKQYRREAKDIFDLQEEVARNITEEIQVFITPEEKSRIQKKPTDDLVAYDYYLKGKDLFYKSTRKEMEESIAWFNKAIERDPKFSLAYASAAMVFYYLDIFNAQKPHSADVDNYAEKAILYDSKSSESMIAKALSFAMKHQYELSVPYLEKALEYDPNSGLVLHFLTEFYNIHVPHPPKYLEYAIRKVKIDRAADSATASFAYFHLSNALLQNGFVDEALKYNEKSLQLNPKNYFAGFVNDYIYFAKDHDAKKAKERLLARWQKDTTRFDILHEVGKMSFIAGDYTTAASCYDRSIAMMKIFGLDIFKHEYLRVAVAYHKTGQEEKATDYISQYKAFADQDRTIYKGLYLAGYYCYMGDKAKANELLTEFARQQDNFLYWLLFMRDDAVVDDMKDVKNFEAAMIQIEKKFWKKHEEVKEKFEDDFRNL